MNHFQDLRKQLLSRLDISRELNDQEILEVIDELVLDQQLSRYSSLQEPLYSGSLEWQGY